MEFPKEVMTASELVKMGFSYDDLLAISRRKNQRICWKMNPIYKNSKLLFDTKELAKYIERCQKTLSDASHARISI